MTDRRYGLVWFALVMASGVSAGCSSTGAGPASPSGDPSGVGVTAQVQSLATGGAELHDAVELLTQRCMAEKGLSYHPVIGGAARGGVAQINGLRSVERAQKEGFSTYTVIGSGDPQDALLAKMSPKDQKSYADALAHGDDVRVSLSNGQQVTQPRHGCRSESQAAIYGSLENYIRIEHFPDEVSGAASAAGSASQDTPRLRSANASYVACMAEQGVKVKTLKDMKVLAKKLPKRAFGTPPPAAETDLAVKDATCQASAGLAAAFDAAVLDASQAWMKSHEKEIAGLAEVLSQSKARAAKIIAGGGAA